MNRKLILIFSFIVFFNISVKAQLQTNSFNLQQCIDYAYKNQVNVKNASIDKEIARYKIKETTGIGLPQIKSVSTYNYFIDVPTQVIPRSAFGDASGGFLTPQFGIANTLSYGLEASQILFNGSYLVGLQASKTYAELSNKALDRTKIDVNVAVSKAYYQLLIARERLILLDANIDRLAKSFKEIKALNENGFVEKIDANRTELIYNNLATEKANTVRLIDFSLQLLKFQIGMPLNENLVINEKLGEMNFTPNLDLGGDTVNYENRIEYSLLKTSLRAAELTNKFDKSSYLPTLVAFANYSRNLQEQKVSNLIGTQFNFPTTIVGVSLEVPIFSGGQRYYKVRQSKLGIYKAQNDLENYKNVVNLETQQGKTNYTNSIVSFKNQKKNMALAEEVVRVSRIKYEQGIGSGLEVTTAETEYKTAQNNYLSALYDALIAKIDLEKAKGNIK